MAKRAKPQWGQDGVHAVDFAQLSSGDLANVMERLPVANLSKQKRQEIERQLQHIAQVYLREIAQLATQRAYASDQACPPKTGNRTYDTLGGPLIRRAESNAALRELARACKKFAKAIAARPALADWQIGDGELDREGGRAAMILQMVERLDGLGNNAMREMKLATPRRRAATARQLDRIVATARTLQAMLMNWDPVTEAVLIDALPTSFAAPIVTAGELQAGTSVVRAASLAAVDARQTRHGLEQYIGVLSAVHELMTLWNTAIGQPATRWPRISGEPDAPRSPADRFLAAFFTAVHPALPQSAIWSAMEALIRRRDAKTRLGANRRGNSRIASATR